MTVITIKILWIFWKLIWNINKKLWILFEITNQLIIIIDVYRHMSIAYKDKFACE
jgi:hypothetical protein